MQEHKNQEDDDFIENLMISPSFITFLGFILTTGIFLIISKIVSLFN